MRPKLLVACLFLTLVAFSFAPRSQSVMLAATAAATPAGNPDCDPAGLIKKLAALKSSGNHDADLATLATVEGQITSVNAACNGLSFKGGLVAKLIGPFELPAGVYKMTVTTPGYLIIHMQVVSGGCEETSIVNASAGEATTGQESIIKSDDCQVVLEPSNVSAPWKLTFELLQTQTQ